MPVMNGLQLVESAKRSFPLLPVILMTSQGSEQIAVEALKAGAASYVPKSDLQSHLAETVRQVLKLAAAKRSERELFKWMQNCETHFELENDPILISQLVGYFLSNLERMGFSDDVIRTQVGIALMEAVSNAMIHGNLEVGSDLKRDDPEAFDRLIHQRRYQQPYSERRIICTARESIRRVEFIVTDEGLGFDATSLPDPIDPENLLRISGRGVMLIRTFMDTVEFNEKGNRITMVKKSPE
jgi:anti-sigma regulatory factor (Ser/Thr protein kinase)